MQVTITVTDSKSSPVSAALVEFHGGENVIQAVTDERGIATMSLQAGKYEITVMKSGFLPIRTSLEVAADPSSVQHIEVELPESAQGHQEITVTATPSNPVAASSSVPAVINVDQAKETPGKPATLAETLPLVPGVIRAPDGSVQIAGYGETHSTLLVNSVDVTDPATGEFGLTIPIDTVETVSVSEMPYLAEYGKFTAGVVAAETRRGSEKWEWSLNDPFPDFRIRSAQLVGVRDASPRLNLSGSPIPGKLYFREGIEYLLYKREVYTLPWGSNETKSDAINSFTQVDWLATPQHVITASLHVAPQSLDFAGLNYFNPQPVTPDANFHRSTVTVIDRLSFGGGLLQGTLANTHVSSGIDPQSLGQMILTPGGNAGSYFNHQDRRANRFQWLENWAPKILHFHGDHQFQIGSIVAHVEDDGNWNGSPVIIKDNQGNAVQTINFSGSAFFGIADTQSAIYGQDHWMLSPQFALDLGLRLERQTITHTLRSAPRLGIVWRPKRLSGTVIRGGLGVFYDSVPLDVYAFSRYPQQTVTTYRSDGSIIDGPRTYQNVIGESADVFGLVSRRRTVGNFAPYSVAGNIELERSIERFLTFRLNYVMSVAEDRLTIQAQNLAGQDAFVLGSGGTAHTRQFEFTARIGEQQDRQFFFSYVRQHAKGEVNDASGYVGNFPFPVIRRNTVGALPGEIPNRFLLWGSYSLPHKFRVTPKVEWRNGFPYQYSSVFQNYVANVGPQPRFPRYFNLDLRGSKDVQISRKHAVRFSGSILNLTNHFNAFEVHNNEADPLFGTFFGNYSRRFMADFDFLY